MSALKNLFGPSKKEIWEQLSKELGGEYKEDGFFKEGKLVIEHGQWEITLDTYTVHSNNVHVTYTRIRAPYLNSNNFRFTIYRKSFFSGLGKIFGMQDVEIGDPQFDEQFIIKGQPEEMVKKLFANREIRALIEKQKAIHFMVKDDEGWFGTKFPDGVDELYFQVQGVVKDKEVLKELFDLFSLVLDELCKMGSAYKTNPNVELK